MWILTFYTGSKTRVMYNISDFTDLKFGNRFFFKKKLYFSDHIFSNIITVFILMYVFMFPFQHICSSIKMKCYANIKDTN